MRTIKLEQFNLSGAFTHIRTNGTAYLIGGAARAAALAVLCGRMTTINDRDFTIIGGTYATKDRNCRNAKRVEIENDAMQHRNLSDYFSSRDLSINQVAIDRKGTLYMTEEAYASFKSGVITAIPKNLSLREVIRAVRFSNELGMLLSHDLKEAVDRKRHYFGDDPVYSRYMRQGFDMEVKWALHK